MGDCGALFSVAGGMIILAAVVAWFVGRFVGRMGEPNTWVILGAIVVSLAVLQIGARLAVIVKGRVEAAGLDPMAVCDGNLGVMSWVATLMIIVAYVGSFFASWRRAKRGM